MASKAMCARCEQEKDGLESAPMGGPMGQRRPRCAAFSTAAPWEAGLLRGL